MNEESGLPYLRETLLFLTLSGLLIPLLLRFRINQVLGFLAVGTVLGPFGLGLLVDRVPWLAWVTFARAEGVAAFAELGVLSLMFMIGLEVSIARLWAMRRWVFGAGTVQVVVTAGVVGAAMRAMGLEPGVSALLGLVLALSSTAVVMQLMDARHAVGTPMGQSVFSILLLQDLAAVPLLVLVGILATGDDSDFAWAMGLALAKALVAVAVIYLVGRRMVRPVFVSFARSHQPDVFMALTLLAALGIAGLTHAVGLSAALGAFLAGLLLSETQYRHAVEVTIEPFRGLLMGLFFMSIGMAVDVRVLLADPGWILAAVAALMAVKALIATIVLRAGGMSPGRAVEGGLLLSQGGEFALIVVGVAITAGVLEPRFGADVLLVVALTMFATPAADRAGRTFGAWLEKRRPALVATAAGGLEPQLLRDHVIVAGFGRVGRLLADVFQRRGVSFVALEADPVLVAGAHAQGLPVYFGDASRADLLRRLRAGDAAAVVLTMDDAASALHAVAAIRADYPQVPVFARARDEQHAALLADAGATLVTPETLEAGLQLATFTLQALGDSESAANAVIDAERERRIGVRAATSGPESLRP